MTLNDDQRLTLHLACEFASVPMGISSDGLNGSDEAITFDADLVTQVKRRFNIDDQAPKEPCSVCGLDIAFNISKNHSQECNSDCY